MYFYNKEKRPTIDKSTNSCTPTTQRTKQKRHRNPPQKQKQDAPPFNSSQTSPAT